MMALTGTALATDVVNEHNTTASFDVSNLTIEDGENVTVTADIDNPGVEPMIQPVELRIDGELIESRDWALNPNETEQITFELSANATEAANLTDESIVSVQTYEHGEVAVFGASQSPEASITFEDQTSDGTNVTVANVSNSETPYYAAVWTMNNETGEPETLLGAAQVAENESSDIAVAFEEPINESQMLVAAVHPDADGNVSTVDPVPEEILASDTANVTVDANDTSQASLTFENQTSDGTTVTVANASFDESPFYVAIYGSNASEEMTMIGLQQIIEDQATNLTITLDEPLVESGSVVAAVHADEDGDAGTIDPVTSEFLNLVTATVTVESGDTNTTTATP
jgi:hypothetical protein